MKYRRKNTLRALAKHLGLKMKFVSYLDENTQGYLLVREKRILLNAAKPRVEHIFTMLHEMGHFLLHVAKPTRRHHPKLLDTHWKAQWLITLSSRLRRYFRFAFCNTRGKEWEANVWALCMFLLLARRCGFRNEWLEFARRHPEMTHLYCLVVTGFVYQKARIRIGSILKPFRST